MLLYVKLYKINNAVIISDLTWLITTCYRPIRLPWNFLKKLELLSIGCLEKLEFSFEDKERENQKAQHT